MARAHYYVVLHQGEWKIEYNGQHFGPYSTQRAAINAAVEAGHKMGKRATMLK